MAPPPHLPVTPPRDGAPSVVQAHFPQGRALVGPHPATVAQPHRTARPPHAATLPRERPSLPHAARRVASAQPFAAPGPHHAATAARGGPGQAAQPSIEGHAFRTPEGFLDQGSPSGRPLPALVQKKMESYFRSDFSDVRVHVGQEAASIGAIAFTVGSDLYFAPGQYEPHTARGQELIGHELTHVVQQREGRVANPFGSGVAVVQDPALEAEADRMGKEAAGHGQVKPWPGR